MRLDWIMQLRLVNVIVMALTLIAMANNLMMATFLGSFAIGWISCRVDSAERDRKSRLEV